MNGYIILTEGPTGAFQPDWDGELHTDEAVGWAELADAREAGLSAVLAEVRVLDNEPALTERP